jgi:cytochrome b subunit of formate dehydrogenase
MQSRLPNRVVVPVILLALVPAYGLAAEPLPDEENYCLMCHSVDEQAETYVAAKLVAEDIHWQKGLRCHDCHGGDPSAQDPNQAHVPERGFREIKSPADIAGFCGHCHSNGEYMKPYQPSPRTEQVTEYWTSVHGQHLKLLGDLKSVTCLSCHGEQDIRAMQAAETSDQSVPVVEGWTKVHDKYVPRAGEKEPATCVSCHGKHGMRAVADPQSAVHPTQLAKTCGACHKEQALGIIKGAHHTAGERGQDGRGTPLECSKCHRDRAHGIRPVRDEQSAVFLAHQVKVCGGCHEEHLQSYQQSVHGLGLSESGLLVTAACADCHGAHGVYLAADNRSTLNPTKVAATCGKCHRFIEERVQASVHGRGQGAGGLAERAAPGGKEKRRPTCTDCHQRHDLADPKSTIFRVRLPNRCGNCHAELSEQYALSIHGELTALGYGPGAKCSDCHGAHDILPISAPASRLFDDPTLPPAQNHRLKTCQVCHPYAAANFLGFDPHADHTNPVRDPLLHWVYVGLLTLLFSVFGLFGAHSGLWSLRSLIHVLQHGRPKALAPGVIAYLRFKPFHRVAHTFMLISFLGLALTGLPLKYSHHQWAKVLAYVLGGFESTRIWHRGFGVFSFLCLGAYLLRMSARLVTGRKQGSSWRELFFGPDSLVPNLRDCKDFFKMVRWFLGLGPKPTFERWSYWEKFDFWGACGDIVIIGFTGLILWFPNLFCSFLPGEVLNIAKVIHSTQALLATGFVFAIHFFNTHFRPEKFPMDLSVLTGLVSEDELREERPEYLARIRERRIGQFEAVGLKEANLEYLDRIHQEGKLDEVRARMPSRARLWLIRLGGFLALAVGLGLLAGMVLASLGG